MQNTVLLLASLAACAAFGSTPSTTASSSPWDATYDDPTYANAVPVTTVVKWLEAGKVNAIVDVRTQPEFEGLGGTDVSACVNDDNPEALEGEAPACLLGHPRLAPYAAGAPHTVQLALSDTVVPAHTIFADSLATDLDEDFVAALGGANMTGLVVGFMCHDGVNPDDPDSSPRSLISARRAQAMLGARTFTLAGGMDAWTTAGLGAQFGAPAAVNSIPERAQC